MQHQTTSTSSLVPLGAFGPRVTPLVGNYPISTLLLGLGQVGWHAVSLFSTMLKSSLALKDPARIQYLAIASRPPVIPAGWLYRNNTLLLTLSETDWTRIPGHYSNVGVARWWPKPLRDKSNAPDPTSVRSYGRLLLFDDPKVVYSTLQQRMGQLVQQSTRPGSDGRRLILIVASLAEAEGSALLLDIASVLRTLLVDSPTTIAAIVTAETSGQTDEAAKTLAMANVYAALKELDAVMMNPTHYQLGLPVLNQTGRLTKVGSTRPLDYFLITGDAESSQPDSPPPAAALVEMVETWLLAHAVRPESPLPALPAVSPALERFNGYTTFNVSKLGLPVSGVVDLMSSEVARQALATLLRTETSTVLPEIQAWVGDTITAFQQATLFDTLLDESAVHERLWELLFSVSTDAIIPEIERNKDKPEFSLVQLGQTIQQRLTHETEQGVPPEADSDAPPPDTLRSRIEAALQGCLDLLEPQFAALPTLLICEQGYSLRWTIGALDTLVKQLDVLLRQVEQEAAQAEANWQKVNAQIIEASRDYDTRYSGIKRRVRGTNNKDLADLLDVYKQAINCAADSLHWTANLVVWQQLRTTVDKLQQDTRLTLQQAERLMQSTTADAKTLGATMAEAAQQGIVRFPAGALVESHWLQLATSQLTTALRDDITPEQLVPHLFSQWINDQTAAGQDTQIDTFLQTLLMTCRHFVVGYLQFAPLRQYLTQNASLPQVKQAIEDFQKAAIPRWLPSRETAERTVHEWLRTNTAGTTNLSLLPPVRGDQWQRLNLVSPDPDEICLIRIVHQITAESIEQLRGPYRRAYERLSAEGIPMHIDRRWDAMLADLIRNNARKEVTALWESVLQGSNGGTGALRGPLIKLIKLFAEKLGIDPESVQQAAIQASDVVLTVFPMPATQLRFPPRQSPIAFAFSNRSPRELGQSIYRAVTKLGLPEPFLFLVNLNNRQDIESVTEVLRNESFNVIVLDEATFKSVVSSDQPMNMLSDLVLSGINLMLVSPFFTKAPVPERMFYGREREIRDVQHKIRTHSVALIGGRRIGKTSTLQQIERMLRLPDSGYYPLYLDCHNVTKYEHFFSALLGRLKLGKQSSDPTYFETIAIELKERFPKQNIIFLFDEIDHLLVTDQEADDAELLFRTFRALSNEGRCKFIFSGERSLGRAMKNADSALFNFAQPVQLTLLEKPVVARLISEPFDMMNVWIEDQATLIDNIYRISAGHPNIVQTICQEMVVALDNDKNNFGLLNTTHLDRALRKHDLQEEIIKTFWGQMSHLARMITLIWPPDQFLLSLDQIMEKVKGVGLPSVSILDLQEAMKNLELYCFVKPQGHQYVLIPVDFPRLLREMALIDIEIGALIETMQQEQQIGRVLK
ncbi:MAG: tubulin-like doman-containing protein [Chloroflexota bacterium]